MRRGRSTSESACFSRGYNLEGCPWRQRAGVPVGTVALAGVDGAAGPGTGIMVGGVPIGEPAFVTEVMRALVAGDVSYIETTVTQLRARRACAGLCRLRRHL